MARPKTHSERMIILERIIGLVKEQGRITTNDVVAIFGVHRTTAEKYLRIALASLEAKPIGAFHIADQQVDGTTDYIKDGEWPIDNGVIEVYAAPPARDNKQTDELVMWVKRLAHSLRNARPNSKLHDAAMDYLSRKGLISVEDVLR
ncbi:DUF977 family protein [Salmonella enterica subsp. enterica serovar Weslaco]|nr:DUF977 family protein [Salmonella enterica]EBZ5930861.1 DUF977 family protein [Salmonella enterica subsp. enterica serovar Weslaco]EBZ6053829.1 DUF977 family protein [Salmonella enterica subsp. enterica serovar Weslaco]EBZ6063227.1 DUF977 family protein [Salmonella enterica subsp. enterica serovar Weslaco]EBZ6072502.1 DUF977 family protein [Salmonella enterica subsp. enterica serovar Weslaco]